MPSFSLTSNPLSLLSPSKNPKTQVKRTKTKIECTQNPIPANLPTRIPTPPWQSSNPLPLSSDQLLLPKKFKPNQQKTRSNTLTQKLKGPRGRQALKQIAISIKRLTNDQTEDPDDTKEVTFNSNVPWAKAEERVMVFRRENKQRVATKAEMEIERKELERLREKGKGLKSWVKAKKSGVTKEVVNDILSGWRKEEVVMVKFVDPLKRNMDRATEIVEMKTGGLVIWRKKDTVVVFRRSNGITKETPRTESTSLNENNLYCSSTDGADTFKDSLYVREANRLLDGLGPRFIDWWWKKPLPVDADLLSGIVPGFMTPFRVCPPDDKPKLRDAELTYLRRLAMHFPTHFALGNIIY